MRVTVCALAAAISLFAHPAFAQSDRAAAAFWRKVRTTCDATRIGLPVPLSSRTTWAFGLSPTSVSSRMPPTEISSTRTSAPYLIRAPRNPATSMALSRS